MNSVFITGGTGTIGRELIKSFLRKTQYTIFVLVHTLGFGVEKTVLLKEILDSDFLPEYERRVCFIYGDITLPLLGISKEEHTKITKEVTFIIHSAASTRFDLSLDDARRINVEGTKNMIQFALDCSQLQKFGFLSTVYVSGKRTGVILEKDINHDAGFVNTYEQSKYEAEHLFQDVSFPTAIYRLSTVVGDSNTGRVIHYTAPHQTLRIMYLGLASMIPGTPEYSVDLISSDYSAQIIVMLFQEHFSSGQIFHIVSGKKHSYTLQKLIDESFAYLAHFNPEWGMRHYPKPIIASEKAFNLFIESIEQANNPLMRGVLLAIKHFAHQLYYPKEFDTVLLRTCLNDYESGLPEIGKYYPKVVEYCLKTHWGKNV